MKTEIFSIFPIEKKNKFKKFFSPIVCNIYYLNFYKNLINNSIIPFKLEEFIDDLDKVKFETTKNVKIFHLFYEFGLFLNGIIPREKLQCCPLAIEIQYTEESNYSFKEIKTGSKLNVVELPSFEEYKKTFDRGYKELLAGNCYQFNLTFPFVFSLDETDCYELANNFFSNKKKLGNFSHYTFLGPEQKGFLSNSPECLFQTKILENSIDLVTMPIKGSISYKKGYSYQKTWEKLKNDEKNSAELDMITDLMRNDLSKIENPTAKVLIRKIPLIVPGILHQLSLIKISLSKNITLGKVIRSIFPGGSITGCPKESVMKIIEKLEKFKRGFYCGSTILLKGNSCDASINIRSAEINLKKKSLTYGAGGGVTLQSNSKDEYGEMLSKVDSLCQTMRR
mgnify:CR=1 FL=1